VLGVVKQQITFRQTWEWRWNCNHHSYWRFV